MAVYVPTAVALGSLTLPADGETIEAVDVNAPLQALGDGLTFESARTVPLADLVALAAITTPADGLVRHVLGFGWYVFKTSATAGLSPFRIAATDATAGGWLSSTTHQTTLIRQVPVGLNFRGITNGGAGSTPSTITPTTTTMSFIVPIGGDAQTDWGSMYPLRTFTGATQNFGYQIDINDELVDGATLASATLRCRPQGGHAGLPTRQPQLAIVRTTVTAVAQVNLLSTGNGYVTMAAANTAAYQADQALVFTPDQNNVIDKTTYRYFAIIIDEAGTNAIAGIGYHSIELSMSAIPDGRRS